MSGSSARWDPVCFCSESEIYIPGCTVAQVQRKEQRRLLLSIHYSLVNLLGCGDVNSNSPRLSKAYISMLLLLSKKVLDLVEYHTKGSGSTSTNREVHEVLITLGFSGGYGQNPAICSPLPGSQQCSGQETRSFLLQKEHFGSCMGSESEGVRELSA